jgi:hypothetical protein
MLVMSFFKICFYKLLFFVVSIFSLANVDFIRGSAKRLYRAEIKLRNTNLSNYLR